MATAEGKLAIGSPMNIDPGPEGLLRPSGRYRQHFLDAVADAAMRLARRTLFAHESVIHFFMNDVFAAAARALPSSLGGEEESAASFISSERAASPTCDALTGSQIGVYWK